MSSQEIKRYALAYFEVGAKQNMLLPICKDLEVLEACEVKFRKIFLSVNSAVVTKETRYSFVKTLLKAHKFHLATQNLLHLLAENASLDLLGKIITQWKILYLDFKAEAHLDIVSVNKIKAPELASIKIAFEKKLGKKVQLKNTLDATILGGIMIKFGSFVLDNSVANKIKNIGFTLKEEQERI